MTKFEMKRTEVEIIERMHTAVTEVMHWACYDGEYDSETYRTTWKLRSDADPDMLALYEAWITKIEKML